VRAPIVLLEGVFSAEQLAEAAHHSFELVVHDPLQLKLLETHRGAHRFVIWIKIDTGMNRLGFRPERFPEALARLRALTTPAMELRVMTHLARADEIKVPMTGKQLGLFQTALAENDVATGANRLATSIGNSAAILGWPKAQGDWVRPGLALYGVSPFGEETAYTHGLKPVMTLETTVLTVRDVKRGETVGYAGAWRAERDSTIAILAAGYGDGLPRHLANGTPVLIGEARYELVGRVSMDMIAVDVTGTAKVVTGNKAIIWGEGLPVEEVAAHAGTIPYELLCGVSQRVPLELK
jgi:alanine racemase